MFGELGTEMRAESQGKILQTQLRLEKNAKSWKMEKKHYFNFPTQFKTLPKRYLQVFRVALDQK